VQTLIALYRRSDQTVTELAEELALRQPTVSTALARLHERDLVTEHPDAADARRRRQRVTTRGRRLVDRFIASLS